MTHRWVKLRLHVYICRVCGCGRVNSVDFSGQWITTWYLPNGDSVIASRRPACQVGARTQAALTKYASEIAARG